MQLILVAERLFLPQNHKR